MTTAMLVFEDARAALLAGATSVTETQAINTLESCGRVLATEVVSSMNVPPMDNSSMDGYALRFADLPVAKSTGLFVGQRIPAGHQPSPLAPGTCARIFTGAPIAQGADMVVIQERVVMKDDLAVIDDLTGLKPGDWIRPRGEDIALGAVLAQKGSFITPVLSGLIASVGVAQVNVTRRVKVACFFTGDELTMPGEPLKPGAIYNSNRFVITACLRQLGCEVQDLGIVPDTLAATQQALKEAASNADLIITSGGVSVGEEDHVKPAVQSLGSLHLWQISMKPGKPLAFGKVGSAHFIGLPGNPVSSYVTFALLAKPFIFALQGRVDCPPLKIKVQADFDFPKPDKRREFLRASLSEQGRLSLFRTQSSGALTSLASSDGLIDNPPGNVINKGDWLDFLPFGNLGL
jgi:molybdopterin molybdotransferase